MFGIFFKSNGPVFIHSVDKGKTVGHKYCAENCPKPFVNEIGKPTETSASKCTKLIDDHR